MDCHPLCQLCLNSTDDQCTKCFDGYILISDTNDRIGKCVQNCSTHSYYNQKLQICIECDISCKNCSGPTNSQCEECSDGYGNKNGECILNCTSDICMFCDICLTCNATNCLSCFKEFALFEGACLSTYDSSTYFSVNSRLFECHPSCNSCFGITKYDCIQCNTLLGFIWDPILHLCIKMVCEKGYYYKDGRCHYCDLHCKECNGPLESECTACSVPYILSGGCCVSCASIFPTNYYFNEICKEICGDGVNQGQYECDDGNNQNNDGCSANCEIEPGWTCKTTNGKDTCLKATKPYIKWVKVYKDMKFDIMYSDGITNSNEILKSTQFTYKHKGISRAIDSIQLINSTHNSVVSGALNINWDAYEGDAIYFNISQGTDLWGNKQPNQTMHVKLTFDFKVKTNTKLKKIIFYICQISNALLVCSIILSFPLYSH